MRSLHIFIVAFSFSVALGSCSKKSNPVVTTPTDTTKKKADTIYTAIYTTPFPSDSNFYTGVVLGKLDPVILKEASGLAASRKYPNFFWTHNDSGNPNDIYLLDSTGKIKAIVVVAQSSNVDWEDIAVAPGPLSGVSYVYVGDIGDNNENHYASAVYRFPEPDINLGDSVTHFTVNNISRIYFQYPNGAHNAETLMVDPLTKDIYVASKDFTAYIYQATYPQVTDSVFTMKELAILPLSTLTAGDISSDGSEILMKNYEQVYYWKRNPGESVISALLREPQTLPYIVEQQGEALCWSINADAYYTTSEFKNGTIADFYKYKRK